MLKIITLSILIINTITIGIYIGDKGGNKIYYRTIGFLLLFGWLMLILKFTVKYIPNKIIVKIDKFLRFFK